MGSGRLEAFSDGVIAIIITIMVLEMKVPEGESLQTLTPLLHVFLSYVLSFVYLGIYWNNHHHMLHVTARVNGPILWANLHLLFWLSLVPFVTGWMGENSFAPAPTARDSNSGRNAAASPRPRLAPMARLRTRQSPKFVQPAATMRTASPGSRAGRAPTV